MPFWVIFGLPFRIGFLPTFRHEVKFQKGKHSEIRFVLQEHADKQFSGFMSTKSDEGRVNVA